MNKIFNINGDCKPDLHYMVNVQEKLEKIRDMVVQGQYFTINRARQYGKTTTLKALENYLKEDFIVINIDFQLLSSEDFINEKSFVEAFSREFLDSVLGKNIIPDAVMETLRMFSAGKAENMKLGVLFRLLGDWCSQTEKPVVLMIDEVDNAANNQIFLDFLAQLRGYYLKRDVRPTFHCVILAGVYDIKNLRLKIRSEKEHKYNSPWNIAADFNVDMSFHPDNIAFMLKEYEADHKTGMDISLISNLIYEYTSGYPYLVSKLCKLMDEWITKKSDDPNPDSGWTRVGFQEAVKQIIKEPNMLFDDMIKKLTDYPELKNMLKDILFHGRRYSYEAGNFLIHLGQMLGFLKEENGETVVANRIFEMKLYNWLISEEETDSEIYRIGSLEKPQFDKNGTLDMKLVLQKFYDYFTEIYADTDNKFIEENGRRLFLLYLKPIINGTGNYYIEARTRNMKRTDVIIDYRGEQYIVELKIWRGRNIIVVGKSSFLSI